MCDRDGSIIIEGRMNYLVSGVGIIFYLYRKKIKLDFLFFLLNKNKL